MSTKSKTPKNNDHVVIDSSQGGTFRCLRCSETYRPNLPAPISMVIAMSNAFIEMHSGCEEWPESESAVERREKGTVSGGLFSLGDD